MMNRAEPLSDTSSSDQTIILENEEIDHVLKKYGSEEYTSCLLPSTSKDPKLKPDIYNLDEFSDGEFSHEPDYQPLEKRIKANICKKSNSPDRISSWQYKFSTDDFCEDSNDFDAVLNRLSQLESEDFQNEPKQPVSKEISTLIRGNIIEQPKSKQNFANVKNIRNSPNSSDEELSNEFDLKSELEKIKGNIKMDMKISGEQMRLGDFSDNSSTENLITESKITKKQGKNVAGKESQRLEKELARAARAREKERKKLEKENQKQLKNALKVVENCVKPDQCIQYLTVNIDESISNTHYGEVIKAGLKSGGYNYKVSKQVVPNLISWTRKVPTIENMLLQDIFKQQKHYMLIMNTPEFIQHIVDNSLTGHIQSLLSMPQIEHLSIAILGLQKYYKFSRDDKNRDFKASVAGVDIRKKEGTEFANLPKVFKNEIEKKLVELQILCKNIYVRPIERFEDLAVFLGECTKSIGQIPYKLARAESLQQENEFFTVNNRDCVKVDKDGNGLGRLWNQFLRMFPLASLETAEAITSVYPTIHSLMEAYRSCETPQDGEKLLQDLPVRRAAGPLGGQRKLGPELSKKVYKFFWSKENVLLC